LIPVLILAGCSSASSGLGSTSAVILSSSTVTTGSHASHRAKHGDLIACSTVRTLGGQTFTVAQLGGGSQLDIESSWQRLRKHLMHSEPNPKLALVLTCALRIGSRTDHAPAMHLPK
jgi:hypothetical protein